MKIYAAIAEKLQALGFEKSTKEVKKKIENLGSKYRLIKRKQMGTGSGAISWPYYCDIHRFLGTLPIHDESLAEESGFSQGSPAQEILQGIARGDVQDEQQSHGCPSPLPVAAPESCSHQTGISPPTAGNTESTEAASSCEAGLDSGSSKKRDKKEEAPTCVINTDDTAAGRTTATSSLSRKPTRERIAA
ncbi:hypothetical protein MTO96_026971 [Rhipicephalus appendiculatus]